MTLSLKALAAAIRREHAACEKAVRSTLEHARRAGNLLIEAQERCDRGEWLPWLEKNCEVSRSVAYSYIRIAREWPALEDSFRRAGSLSCREAIRILDTSGTDDDVEPLPEQTVPEDLAERVRAALPAEQELATIASSEQEILARAKRRQSKRVVDARQQRLARIRHHLQRAEKLAIGLGDEAEDFLSSLEAPFGWLDELEEAA